ncbi:MAG: DHH family phosphoesterase [Candidatus Diapherotrites archaeon]|nr:DHH family phosphoesterase [Candidatus Diapherotrites archaeon]
MFPSLKQFRGKIAIITHSGADADAFCSAAALFLSMPKTPKPRIVVPDHMNQQAKSLSEKLGIPFQINASLEGFGTAICVDFQGTDTAGTMQNAIRNFKGKLFCIDHHLPEKNLPMPKQNALLDPEAVSATQVVFSLLCRNNAKVSKKAATLIALGIIDDSANLLVSTPESLQCLAECLKLSGLSISELRRMLEHNDPLGERIAKIKAMQRTQLFRHENALIAATEIGSYEADVALALVGLGADVAFAASFDEKSKELRISARANNVFLKKTGLSLAKDVMQKLPQKFSGSGGGHDGAAAFNSKAESFQPALDECVKLATQFIEKAFKEKPELKEGFS